MTGANYRLEIHRPDDIFQDDQRANYFSNIARDADQVIFLDPDNGFEPKNRTDKHVGFADVESILDQVSQESVVTVFQYHRRKAFEHDLRDIRRRIVSGFSTAIYEKNVMFVSISRSKGRNRVGGPGEQKVPRAERRWARKQILLQISGDSAAPPEISGYRGGGKEIR